MMKKKETGRALAGAPVSSGNPGVAPPIGSSIPRNSVRVKISPTAFPPEILIGHLLDWGKRSFKDAMKELAKGDLTGAKDMFAISLYALRQAIGHSWEIFR